MFMKKAFAAVLATAVLVAGAVEAKDLRVASNTTFPPFEFVNTKTQEITGFEMDLIRAMGKQAGYEVKITNMAFDGIIPAVLSGSVDVGASGFSVTEERKKRVLFTEPFYKSGLTVLVAKGNEDKIQGFKDLDGRKLAVQIGTTAAAKAKDIKDAKVQTFNNAGDAILELANGGCEAVINDKPVTDYMLVQSKSIADQTTHLKPIATADLFAMVFAKNNSELKAEADKALKALKADGTFNKLHEKWFGVPADPELP